MKSLRIVKRIKLFCFGCMLIFKYKLKLSFILTQYPAFMLNSSYNDEIIGLRHSDTSISIIEGKNDQMKYSHNLRKYQKCSVTLKIQFLSHTSG